MKERKDALVGGLSGFVNGLLGSGGGSISVLGLKQAGMDDKKAHGTTTALILPLTIISAIIYLLNDSIEWRPLLLVSIGGIVGGLIGAQLLNRFSNKWIRGIFGLVLVVSGIQTLIR